MGLRSYIEGCGLHEVKSAISCRHTEWTKISIRKDYVLSRYWWVAKCQKFDTVVNDFHLRLQSLSTLGGYFVQLFVLWGHMFCLLSGDGRLTVSQRLKIYYFYGKVDRGYVVCLLYRGSPYLGESIMEGSTVLYAVTVANSVLPKRMIFIPFLITS